jgi:hypothetical protein
MFSLEEAKEYYESSLVANTQQGLIDILKYLEYLGIRETVEGLGTVLPQEADGSFRRAKVECPGGFTFYIRMLSKEIVTLTGDVVDTEVGLYVGDSASYQFDSVRCHDELMYWVGNYYKRFTERR